MTATPDALPFEGEVQGRRPVERRTARGRARRQRPTLTSTLPVAQPAPGRRRETRSDRGASTSRIAGIDIARALAIVGMFAVHVGPLDDPSLAGRLYAQAHGRASLLFVLVAGVGVSLLARARRESLREARWSLAWRAVILLPAGLALQTLDHGVNVILQGYALLFILALLVLAFEDRWLLVGAGVAATAGPLLFLWGRLQDPGRFQREAIAWGDSTAEVVDGLVLSGPYPLITWAAPLLIGMWLGRRDLGQAHVQRRLLLTGLGLAAGAAAASELATRQLEEGSLAVELTSIAAHSQMPLWLTSGTGVAMALLAAAIWAGQRAPRLLRPLSALGQLAFTAYVLHLVALHLAGDALRPGELAPSLGVVAGGSALLAVGALIWQAHLGRGPLERTLRPPRAIRAAVRPGRSR